MLSCYFLSFCIVNIPCEYAADYLPVVISSDNDANAAPAVLSVRCTSAYLYGTLSFALFRDALLKAFRIKGVSEGFYVIGVNKPTVIVNRIELVGFREGTSLINTKSSAVSGSYSTISLYEFLSALSRSPVSASNLKLPIISPSFSYGKSVYYYRLIQNSSVTQLYILSLYTKIINISHRNKQLIVTYFG